MCGAGAAISRTGISPSTCTCWNTRGNSVLRFVLRRLLSALPTLLVIATLAFVLLHLTPGGPFDSDRVLVPQIQHSIEVRFHLDEPLWRQYLRYLGDRKSTRLNSSHPSTSYAVFCLKKKKNTVTTILLRYKNDCKEIVMMK